MNWDQDPSISAGSRRTKHDPILRQEFTYCGVTNSIGAWLHRLKMAPNTFVARVTKQGLTPLEALTRPDRNGNCLRPLSEAELAAERKRLRKQQTKYASGGGTPRYQATLGTDTGTIDLGTFNSQAEAVYAINVAMTRRPEDWQREDHWKLPQPLAPEVRATLERRVDHALAEHDPARCGLNHPTETSVPATPQAADNPVVPSADNIEPVEPPNNESRS